MRVQEPEQIQGRKPAKKAAPNPVPETPPAEVAPVPVAGSAEPVAVTPPPQTPAPAAKKAWPVKSKRPRFVRPKAEKREGTAPAPLPPPSTRPAARLMTKNLALPPKTDGTTPLR